MLLQANQLAAKQEQVASLYHLADKYVLMAPALAQASGMLPSLFLWAVLALQLREAEPLRCVISFLSHWTAPMSGLLSDADKQVIIFDVLLYCAVLCRAMPCRAVPCRAVPCRAVPCSQSLLLKSGDSKTAQFCVSV